jgi:hypothetical protein
MDEKTTTSIKPSSIIQCKQENIMALGENNVNINKSIINDDRIFHKFKDI